jgi:nitroreductase
VGYSPGGLQPGWATARVGYSPGGRRPGGLQPVSAATPGPAGRPSWPASPAGIFALVELDTLILKRRMCRSFLERPIEPAALERALALAVHAPSAGHSQGWAFVVLQGGVETEVFWEEQADPAWRAAPQHPGLLKAPAIVLPLANRSIYTDRYSEPDKVSVGGPRRVGEWQVPYWLVDAAFATMLLLLGIAREGLGALFFALQKPAGPLLARLGVPAGWEPIGAVAVGWPDPGDRPSTSASRARRRVSEVVHWGAWGGKRFQAGPD